MSSHPPRGEASVGQGGCLCALNPDVTYDGPRAASATLGGSPTWGLGDRFHEFAATLGHERLGVYRPATPYGPGPQVEHYRSPSGRELPRIPTYGQVYNEDPFLRASEWKTFWILWQAGVKVPLVGGTSGSCDWRRGAADTEAVRPGDLVLPASYLPRDTMPTGLPGAGPTVAATLELNLLDRLAEPSGCRCRELLRQRPPEFARALSPSLPG